MCDSSIPSEPQGLAIEDTWRALDAANSVLIETSAGRIVIEMRPDFAPAAAARIKLLAREGLYDGLLFHRVIDGYVAQTGNPNNRDSGSAHPDLPAEFTFPLAPDRDYTAALNASDRIGGFIGAASFEAEQPAVTARRGRPPRAWGCFCAGAVGMGRWENPHTANSEIFFMRESARRLEHQYTMFATVVDGLEVVRRLAVGEPAPAPDRMTRVRVIADLAAEERPSLQVMNTRSAAFRQLVAEARAARGADFSMCDITVPVIRR